MPQGSLLCWEHSDDQQQLGRRDLIAWVRDSCFLHHPAVSSIIIAAPHTPAVRRFFTPHRLLPTAARLFSRWRNSNAIPALGVQPLVSVHARDHQSQPVVRIRINRRDDGDQVPGAC